MSLPEDEIPGAPLAPWTYYNDELFELEYEALFLRRWQVIGHVNDVPEPGDYITADIGRDSVVALRDKDNTLRAFLNVCRHRASRIFEGSGSCRGVVKCPYHGWTYRLDGTLMAIPQEKNFPGLDRSRFGLHAVQLDVMHGLIFVRVLGDGPGLAEQFAHRAQAFAKYDTANHHQIAEPDIQIWDVNWKVAWDNYLENYHLPVGHPGLHRLVKETDDVEEFASGVSYGSFKMNEKLSGVAEERRYQEMLHHADERLPEDVQGHWVQIGLSPSMGLELYPEMLDLFQIIPLAPQKSIVRTAYYGHRNPTPEVEELRRLNLSINSGVNNEDKILCTRVQRGLQTHGYRPGVLSTHEISVFRFHELVRSLVPVAALPDAPPVGSVAAENARMKQQIGDSDK